MFTPRGLGAQIFAERYAVHPEENWPMASRRVARAIAANENGARQTYYEKVFYDELNEGRLMPGGRIWKNAGTKVQSLLNCFVVPTEDSIEGWGKTVSDLMKISSVGGGVGMNFSNIRGRGAPISRGGESSGAVSLMDVCNSVGDVLRAGGGRRVAMMHTLDFDHPDATEFVEAKLENGRLNNANLSVNIPPDAEYGDLHGDVFDRVVRNAWASGEPGILNHKLAEEQSNVFYSHRLSSTNPCGEIWLPDYGCCCLGALVLPRFVEAGKFRWVAFESSIRAGVRFLDNVLDINDYPLPETRRMCLAERRIGLGIMGLHTLLLDLGLRYTSDAGFAFVDKLFWFMSQVAYDASQKLAREKGVFPLWHRDMVNSGYFQANPVIPKRPMRNCAVLTLAPTGTTSMVHNVSSGIEPVFAARYVRRRYTGETLTSTLVYSAEYQRYGDEVESALEIKPEDHLRMQATVQRYVDNAVSKTINLPNDYAVEDLSGLVEKWIPYLKGLTFYRQGSRGDEPLEVILSGAPDPVTDETEYVETEYVDPCENGVCAL
jgi:ribonucleoside-diphosphate reductase alpha chain